MRAMLQRKCGCGGACGPCKEKRELRRTAIDPRRPDTVPRSVDRVLGSSGAPLDASLRQTFEPRFGHDFSSVRVHTDADAANAAKDVHARAWTVGDHIAFGAGHSPRDRSLLAHELTHIVQQSAIPQSSSLSIGASNDPAESEADAVADAVMSGRSASIAARGNAVVRGQFDEEFDDPWPEKTAAARLRAEWKWREELRMLEPAGSDMREDEITKAEAVTGTRKPEKRAVADDKTPIFVLHDTDAAMQMSHIEEQEDKRGPQGLGVTGFMPRPQKVTWEDPETRKKMSEMIEPDLVMTRPSFYEEKRPSTTAHERADDVLSGWKRSIAFRAAWKVTKPDEKTGAIDRGFAGTGLDDKTDAKLKKDTRSWLSGMSPTTDGVKTAAGWVMAEVCKRVTAVGAEAVAIVDEKAKKQPHVTLAEECAKLADWFQARLDRIQPLVAVEIVQKHEGFDNPPYTEAQYEGVAHFYLRAALAAHRFPFITTHWQIDKKHIGGHVDPRCFNVHKLYRLIAQKVAHGAATIYGIEPKYGTKPEHNVYWTKSMCHGGPPA